MAIRVGRDFSGPDWGGAQELTLFAEQVGPVLSPLLPVPAAPEDLLCLPLLHTRTRPQAWPDWLAPHALTAPEDPPARWHEHFYFMLEAATAGLGVAIAPLALVRDDLAAGRLRAPFGFAPNGMRYAALAPPRRSRDAQALLDWLQDQARTPPQAP